MNDQDRITQLEAACAAMLRFINIPIPASRDIKAWQKYSASKNTILSTDAGKSLLDRLQAVEKEHTALRLAAEELVTYVRHGDQEDIGEAMGKIEALLQPAQKERKPPQSKGIGAYELAKAHQSQKGTK